MFLSPFQAVHICSEAQYLHVTRYIHINRYASGINKHIDDILSDPYSSAPDYFQSQQIGHQIVYTHQLQGMFESPEAHWRFIADHADYQRSLERIKHLILE